MVVMRVPSMAIRGPAAGLPGYAWSLPVAGATGAAAKRKTIHGTPLDTLSTTIAAGEAGWLNRLGGRLFFVENR